MNAVIVSVGHELTTGQAVDTNSAYLSRELTARGFDILRHETVGDDRAAIAASLARAGGEADVVLVTGGLGPTEDDLTRLGLADALGCGLRLDERSLAIIAEFFARRGRLMNDTNRVQAMIPEAAKALYNEVGTAPGLLATLDKAAVFVMPGVPQEMRVMFEREVAPRLPAGGRPMLHKIVHTFGEGESDVGAKIADLMARQADPLVGTTVAAGMVSVRITARGDNIDDAALRLRATADEIRRRLGDIVVGEDDQTIASVVGELLRQRRQKLATAESCTGGHIGKLITDTPGSSDYYLGGIVAYANEVKIAQLDVPTALLTRYGAVSEPVAAALAGNARKRFGSDWAISITGIAGPGGGTDEKPVGLVYIGLAGEVGVQVQKHVFPGTRDLVRLRSSLAALNLLRLALMAV